ncbi:hypothetical protein ACWEQO_19620 [Streptomyces sp. NPDC004051]
MTTAVVRDQLELKLFANLFDELLECSPRRRGRSVTATQDGVLTSEEDGTIGLTALGAWSVT